MIEMNYSELPQKEKLTITASTFKCELCSEIIGAIPDKNGGVKPESITSYYRIMLRDPMQFVFCCPTCAEKY